jgi:septal ring factor EnvC (AmiA/AmiB activator)
VENKNIEKDKALENLKDEVLRLRDEKQKLEKELKSREEMMSNLLSFIENGIK